jgi:superfamily II DNA or RNA helicase
MDLRPYQIACASAVEAEWPIHRRVLIVLPTGTGKTIVFSALAGQAGAVNGARVRDREGRRVRGRLS